MKKKIIMGTISLLLITYPVFANEETCDKFASTMTSKVVDIFHDSKESDEQKRNLLRGIFQQSVDTDWIGKFVLGRFWKSASAPEQAEYLKVYRDYITNNYISKFDDEAVADVSDIKVVSVTPQQDNEFQAKTLIKQKKEDDVSVDYLLEQNKNGCLVHDIKLEGVSLITSQRSEFTEVAGKSGVRGVIDAMKQKLHN